MPKNKAIRLAPCHIPFRDGNPLTFKMDDDAIMYSLDLIGGIPFN